MVVEALVAEAVPFVDPNPDVCASTLVNLKVVCGDF